MMIDEKIGGDVGRRERSREENVESHDRDTFSEKLGEVACVTPMTCTASNYLLQFRQYICDEQPSDADDSE